MHFVVNIPFFFCWQENSPGCCSGKSKQCLRNWWTYPSLQVWGQLESNTEQAVVCWKKEEGALKERKHEIFDSNRLRNGGNPMEQCEACGRRSCQEISKKD